MERTGCFGASTGLDTSNGGLWTELFFTDEADGAEEEEVAEGGGERTNCERLPIISAADVLFNGAGCYGNNSEH